VNGDTTAQAIQLKMRSGGNNVLSGTVRLRAWDAAGLNPIVLSNLGAGINSGACATNGEILLATAAFSSKTTPAAVPDFVMLAPIPSAYLAAGSLTFEGITGSPVYWRLSWGGAAYTGTGAVSIDNDADLTMNPPFPLALPTMGADAVRKMVACPAASTNNSLQYGITAGAAVFENNDQQQFTVNALAVASVPVLPGFGFGALAAGMVAAGVVIARRRAAS